MALAIKELDGGKLIQVEIEGKLNAADYAMFTPRITEMIERHGKISIVVALRDFQGWGVQALWEDIKFDARHFNDFHRIAMVGDKQWESAMATFCKPFTTGQVKFFSSEQLAAAVSWASDGLELAAPLTQRAESE